MQRKGHFTKEAKIKRFSAIKKHPLPYLNLEWLVWSVNFAAVYIEPASEMKLALMASQQQ